MGTVDVAIFAASAATVLAASMTVTLRLTSSATNVGSRLTSPSAKRSRSSSIGFINRLAPAGHALSAAVALAEILASRPALALSLIRAGVRDSLNQTTQEAITRTLADSHRVFTGADIEEGIDAFFAKRAPLFTAGRSGTRAHKRNDT